MAKRTLPLIFLIAALGSLMCFSGPAKAENGDFLKLDDVWGMSCEEIAVAYPDKVLPIKQLKLKYGVYNDYFGAGIPYEGDLCVPLGWSSSHLVLLVDSPEGGVALGYALFDTWPDIVSDRIGLSDDVLWEDRWGFPRDTFSMPAVINREVGPEETTCPGLEYYTFRQGKEVSYCYTISTPQGAWDYVWMMDQGYFGKHNCSRYTFIPHGCLDIAIPIDQCDIRLITCRCGYTGEPVSPRLEVAYHGYELKEGRDYTCVSNAVEPGDAFVTLEGKGYFTGSVRVDFRICETRVELEPVTPVRTGKECTVQAKIYAILDREGAERLAGTDTVTWTLNAPEGTVEWYRPLVLNTSPGPNGEYRLERSLFLNEPGKYLLTVTYEGVSSTRELIVEPEIFVEAGPLLADGTLACPGETSAFQSYTDIRFCAELGAENQTFLREYMAGLPIQYEGAKDKLNVVKEGLQYFIRVQTDENGVETGKSYIAWTVRAVPAMAANAQGPFYAHLLLNTDGGQRIDAEYSVSNGKIVSLAYRSDGQNGTDTLIGKSTTAKHSFYYNDSFFYGPSNEYNNSLAVMTLGLEMTAASTAESDAWYEENLPEDNRAQNILSAYRKLGFWNVELYKYDAPLSSAQDSVAFSLATKYISSGDSDDTLIAVVIRGIMYGAEWVGNFNIGPSGDHKGFSTACDGVVPLLENYVERLAAEGKIVGNVKFWVTGFSRGGAVANLLAVRLNSMKKIGDVQILPENQYIYTFAAPAGCRSRCGWVNNAFNVVSLNDMVPKLAPAAWNFIRAGKDVVLPEKTPDAVAAAFGKYTGETLYTSDNCVLEDSLISALCSLYPDSKSFGEVTEKTVRLVMKNRYSALGGDFVMGFAEGLLYGVIGDQGKAFQEGDFPEKTKIMFTQAYSFYNMLTLAADPGDLLDFRSDLHIMIEGLLDTDGMDVEDCLQAAFDTVVEPQISSDAALPSRLSEAKNSFLETILYDTLINDQTLNLSHFKEGIAQAHWPEHYLAWLETGGDAQIASEDGFAHLSDAERETINAHMRQFMNGSGK